MLLIAEVYLSITIKRYALLLQGQTKIADHLRKSYSLNDLTDEQDGSTYSRQESLDLTDDEDAVGKLYSTNNMKA